MFPHPILATEDDKDFMRRSILLLPEDIKHFFALLERVYGEGKSEEAPSAHAVFYSIQSTLRVLKGVPSSSYRKKESMSAVDKELPKNIERIGRLFLDNVVTVSSESLVWNKPATRLAEEAAQHIEDARIEFPRISAIKREAVSYGSLGFLTIIFLFIATVLLSFVVMIALPVIRPPKPITIILGAISSALLALSSASILFFFLVATRALEELFERLVGERMHGKSLDQSTVVRFDDREAKKMSGTTIRVKRGRDTRKGYYTFSYGDSIGYIDGKHVDTQVVMIGFDKKYVITRWNTAAEVMTGFVANGCIGKPLSDLVITPGGDIVRDLSTLEASKGDALKVKLRAFATTPVTLFTICVPILNSDGERLGSILICANAKDNMGVFRSYIRDYITSEVNVSLSELVDNQDLNSKGNDIVSSLQSFLTSAYDKQTVEVAREMLTEWEWTTAEQLCGETLRSSAVRHKRYVDPMFPATLCLHPNVSKTISAILNMIGISCMVKLRVQSRTRNVFALAVMILPKYKSNHASINSCKIKNDISPYLEKIFGTIFINDHSINLRFPCQVTALLEDAEDAAFNAFEAGCERSIIDQARAIVNCTVNVLTLITDLVDQHNLSMILLKTMFVSLTNVRKRDDLEKRLQAAPNDVDVIVCDRDWLNSARDIIISSGQTVLVVPLVDSGVSFISEEFQYLIHTPISGDEVRKILMDVGKVVSLRKNAATAREERERILTLRQDSPWTKGKLLGRGSFGAVYEATSDLTGGKMAVKMFYFSADSEESINKLLNEIKIMCSLNHPNIVHYFHCERMDNDINLFMELCDASLGDIITGRKLIPLSLTVIQILYQVLAALTYLHARDVAHRDVKPQNILLKGDTIKITDFGTARKGEANKDVQGTLRYMAPEVYRGESHSSPCDIWSVGCLACELFACPPKFMNNSMVLAEMASAVPYLENLTNSEPLSNFLRKCFHYDPEKRPAARDLLLDPIFSTAHSSEMVELPTVFTKASLPGRSDFSITSQKE